MGWNSHQRLVRHSLLLRLGIHNAYSQLALALPGNHMAHPFSQFEIDMEVVAGHSGVLLVFERGGKVLQTERTDDLEVVVKYFE